MEKQKIKAITEKWKKEGLFTLTDYLAGGGFSVLSKVLKGDIPTDDVLEELEQSGLRGRGGSGFFLGQKWRAAFECSKDAPHRVAPARSHAYFICNADESEPGTYKDRAILDNNPYPVIEAIILGSFIIGAEEAFIYLNGGYKETAARLKTVLIDLKKKKWLGKNIQNSDFSLRIKIFEGAGSYVCGEETALINSIEGKRGEPRLRPPYPVEKGLFNRPTVVNNVETLVNVPFILEQGASKFKILSKSKKSFGTKIFLLGGPLKRPGLHEAPLGVSINDLISNWGGGLIKDKKIKFAQVGGSGGTIVRPSDFDKPLGFGKGEISVGSGAVLLVEEGFDVKKLIAAWSHFFRRESCGQCVPCREGTYQLSLLAKKLKERKLSKLEREKVEDIIFTMEKASFCAFGSFAVKGWKGIVNNFPEEIIE